ncbi:MAG: hypothetical protein LKI80_08220 [Sporolactobacillus sp.]|jgi:hypothetical protein|nr:hypothetical protein [Sporolactobacillus sp.]
MNEKHSGKNSIDFPKLFDASDGAGDYLNKFFSTIKRGRIKSNRNKMDCIARLSDYHSLDRLRFLRDSLSSELAKFKVTVISIAMFLILLFLMGIRLLSGPVYLQIVCTSIALIILIFFGYQSYKRYERLRIYAFYLKKAMEWKQNEAGKEK